MARWFSGAIDTLFRERGLLQPAGIRTDFVILTGVVAVASAAYWKLTQSRPASVKEQVLLGTGVAITAYAARFLLFGTRWGVDSTFFMAEPLLHYITPRSQWGRCPATDPSECDLSFCHQGRSLWQAGSAPNHFSPFLHYFPAFVQQRPSVMMLHLFFITTAGLLWPLQIWHGFRSESYKRHRLLGRLALAIMFGALATASIFAWSHLTAHSLAEKVTGLGFAAQITATLYNLAAGYRAARRRDIRRHQRCVVRMVGLAYGVFPFKHIFVVASSLLLPGHWAYAAGVWLSSPVGMLITERTLLQGLPSSDAQHKMDEPKAD